MVGEKWIAWRVISTDADKMAAEHSVECLQYSTSLRLHCSYNF